MNLPCKELKRIARDNLNGNYKIPMGAFLAATLIPLAVELPFSMLQKDAQPLPVTIMFYVAEFLITLLRTAFDYCNADQLYSCDHRCCVIFCPGQVACGDCSTGDTWYCEHDSGSFRADVVCTGIVSAFGSSADEGTRIIKDQPSDHEGK